MGEDKELLGASMEVVILVELVRQVVGGLVEHDPRPDISVAVLVHHHRGHGGQHLAERVGRLLDPQLGQDLVLDGLQAESLHTFPVAAEWTAAPGPLVLAAYTVHDRLEQLFLGSQVVGRVRMVVARGSPARGREQVRWCRSHQQYQQQRSPHRFTSWPEVSGAGQRTRVKLRHYCRVRRAALPPPLP